MRLTNVAHLRLPAGRLHSYDVVIEATDEELPVSFDQGRHVGEGDRPGSWMAISFRLAGAERHALGRAWDAVVARHGTLRTVFRAGERVRLFAGEQTPGVWRTHATDAGMTTALREAFDSGCRPHAAGSFLLCLVEPDAGEPVVVIGSDHAHVDMWSLLVLGRDLARALRRVQAGEDADLEPAHPFAEHTALLEAMGDSPAGVRDEWERLLAAGGQAMPRFPLPLGDMSRAHDEVVEVRDVLDPLQVVELTRVADMRGVRPTAVALAAVTRATRRVADAPLRAVFPVHSRNDPRWTDAVGWFITNSVIECEDGDPAACAADVRRALQLGSHPLAPVFVPRGGMPRTPGMFALSWLDTRRLPVAVDDPQASWISAVIRTNGVMIWFVINDTGLHLRCRYPDTAEARASLTLWLDAVESELRAAATASVPIAG